MNLVEADHIRVQYENGKGISGISFVVQQQDCLCIVGENGSGKTTLMKALLGLLPLQAGTLRYCGVKRDQIGYLPQQKNAQRTFPATVWEVVQSGCLNQKRGFTYSAAQKQRAKEQMELMEIAELQAQCYGTLSGGQQQRVALARALCATSRLLVLDEPLTGLDPTAAQALYHRLQALRDERGIAIVMVSHDLEQVLCCAEHILHLGADGAWFYGTKEEYCQSPIGQEFLHRGEHRHG